MSKHSEKAMRLAQVWEKRSPFARERLANLIDAHTAQALSEQAIFYQKQLDTLTETVKEHKRVLDECEGALEFYSYKSTYEQQNISHDYHVERFREIDRDWGAKASQALATIAELKTNEKLGA